MWAKRFCITRFLESETIVKTLFRYFFILCLLAALGFGWFRQSIHYALMELTKAVQSGNVAVVEKHMDLEAFVGVGGRFAAALARAEGRKFGGAAVGALVGGLAEALSDRIGDAVKPKAVMELKREIARGEAFRSIGPFTLAEGYDAYGDVSTDGDRGRVVVVGTCAGNPASVVVLMERISGPFGFKWLGTWKATDVDEGSLLILAESCRDGGKAPKAKTR